MVSSGARQVRARSVPSSSRSCRLSSELSAVRPGRRRVVCPAIGGEESGAEGPVGMSASREGVSARMRRVRLAVEEEELEASSEKRALLRLRMERPPPSPTSRSSTRSRGAALRGNGVGSSGLWYHERLELTAQGGFYWPIHMSWRHRLDRFQLVMHRSDSTFVVRRRADNDLVTLPYYGRPPALTIG
jgi:hypothetical protein